MEEFCVCFPSTTVHTVREIAPCHLQVYFSLIYIFIFLWLFVIFSSLNHIQIIIIYIFIISSYTFQKKKDKKITVVLFC